MVGVFFYPGLWKDTKLFCLLPSLHLLPNFHSPCLLLSCQIYHPPHPSFPPPCPCRLPGDLFCFLLCFFFCFECLSLQVSVAGDLRSAPSGSSVNSPSPWGNALLCFGGIWGRFLFFSFLFCFFPLPFFPFYLEGMGGSGNREVGGGFCLFF